ncbi:hypothetical protein EJ08DRAFT_334893 [Tothia fuscella]|uniref:Uncharacterized protein n=1 Tax=Tothia fuscella TaxID=1048955 RepID=A0A9P4P212_9PEZI|nr:hypothetical protein EJ08DRAFT_334893 [Tothia fuscella]
MIHKMRLALVCKPFLDEKQYDVLAMYTNQGQGIANEPNKDSWYPVREVVGNKDSDPKLENPERVALCRLFSWFKKESRMYSLSKNTYLKLEHHTVPYHVIWRRVGVMEIDSLEGLGLRIMGDEFNVWSPAFSKEALFDYSRINNARLAQLDGGSNKSSDLTAPMSAAMIGTSVSGTKRGLEADVETPQQEPENKKVKSVQSEDEIDDPEFQMTA